MANIAFKNRLRRNRVHPSERRLRNAQGKALVVTGLRLLLRGAGGGRDPGVLLILLFLLFLKWISFPTCLVSPWSWKTHPCPVLVGLSTLGVLEKHLVNPG